MGLVLLQFPPFLSYLLPLLILAIMNKNYLVFVFLFCFFISNISGQTTLIPDLNFEQALIDLNIDSDNTINQSVATDDISGITNLAIYNKGIADLTGIQDFISLTQLNCGSNQVTSIDLSQNIALEKLYCANNTLLTSIDVSLNTALWLLNIANSQISDIDLSNNLALKEFSCQNSEFSSIDASNNTALTWLKCDYNMLTNLDLSQNLALTDLYCNNNPLTNLVVNNNINLRNLICYSTGLTSIDVSQNTALINLNCYSNLLTNIDVSNNTNLMQLRCYNNQITSLDLSLNTALTSLFCYDNLLTSLDVKNGNNTSLIFFNAENNNALECIQVDDETAANTSQASYANWVKDAVAFYSEDCESALSVEEELLEQGLSYYPNPVHDVLTINSKIPLTKVELYSILGKKVKEISSEFETISVNDLSDGIYLVKIESELGIVFKRLIKK